MRLERTAAFLSFVALSISTVHVEGFAAFAGANKPVSALLEEHSAEISSLKDEAAKVSSTDAPEDDVFYLRYCLANFDGGGDERKSSLVENMKWRSASGKFICDAARKAVAEATAGDGWNNDPILAAAPHASVVKKYIGSSQRLTTSSRPGDLVDCIRAGKIDDNALMSELSVEDMTDFFLYCREINSIVANQRSVESDRLASIVTANDLAGVKLVGGNADFRKALGAGSTQANKLYPSLAGPTLLLNLPKLLSALVKLFTPLFPEEVRQRLKFERGPLSDVDDLSDVWAGGAREDFLDYLDKLVYSD